ncbi:MAG: LPS export ABC transporter periplasmic protein LptC [Bacteroidetes bacterium]|nr:LPS export ABC transporter periplasmic protein LptC [Bacteroidota bacterium]
MIIDPALLVETGKETEILYSEDGIIKVKIVGKEIKRHKGEKAYSEFTKGVRVYFYNADLKVKSRLTAEYGIKYDHDPEMTVRNNVVVLNTKGERLNTEELIWHEEEQKISSDKFVKITTPEEIIYGDGFESNQDFTNYRIKKIRGTIAIKEDEVL